MAAICIMCAERAGSGEHVFPAALGGRRKNKGIYCHDHNIGFSPLVKILSDQFAAINALLSIRPDYSNQARKFVQADPDSGAKYELSGPDIQLAEPHIVWEKNEGGTRQAFMRFSDEGQKQKWLAQQRAAGVQISYKEAPRDFAYFTKPLTIPLSFGGPEGLKAIGYIALTFFAQRFPIQARQPGLDAFKRYVLGEDGTKFVWWDTSDTKEELTASVYRFEHRIDVSISTENSRASAQVSLFDTFKFAVSFGSVAASQSKTVIIQIDPEADLPPRDITVTTIAGRDLAITQPDFSSDELRSFIEKGLAQKHLVSCLVRSRTLIYNA